MSVVCPECEEEYESIGTHWRYKPEHRIEIPSAQKSIFTGLLMGDGTLIRKNKTPYMTLVMTNKEFIEYISSIFGCLAGDVKIKHTPEEASEAAKRINPEAKPENYSTQFILRFTSHPYYNSFKSWYGESGKEWPVDFDYDLLTFKTLYCCDGHYDNSGTNSELQLSATNEMDNKQKLKKIVNNFGLPQPSRMTQDNIVWDVKSSEKIFAMMGGPMPGFEYKWPEEYRQI